MLIAVTGLYYVPINYDKYQRFGINKLNYRTVRRVDIGHSPGGRRASSSRRTSSSEEIEGDNGDSSPTFLQFEMEVRGRLGEECVVTVSRSLGVPVRIIVPLLA